MNTSRSVQNSAQKMFTKAWVVAVDMGYGHQRAAFPLKGIAYQGIVNANAYPGIPSKDRKTWESGRKFYENISRMKRIPVFGDSAFGLMDKMQRILPFYPRRDLRKPTLQLRQIYWMIRRGWGRDLIQRLNRRQLPLITTFFTPAFFAEEHGYQGEIYLITTDADVSRAWASFYPERSRIQYLVPNIRVRDRLLLYGVRKENIFLTGFPLPKANLGLNGMTLKSDLAIRICNLDPKHIYHKKYDHTLHHYLGRQFCPTVSKRPLTITFAVGGAGAQRELGAVILRSLRQPLKGGALRLNLIAGIRKEVYDFFYQAVRTCGLTSSLKKNIFILYDEKKYMYFQKFNRLLRTTDVLWTKPSELVFYTALGLPIIMAPPIGSQEEFNAAWLASLGSGINQLDPHYTHEWFFDWLASGWIAEAAMNGFLDAPQAGTSHIEDVVLRGIRREIEEVHLW